MWVESDIMTYSGKTTDHPTNYSYENTEKEQTKTYKEQTCTDMYRHQQKLTDIYRHEQINYKKTCLWFYGKPFN